VPRPVCAVVCVYAMLITGYIFMVFMLIHLAVSNLQTSEHKILLLMTLGVFVVRFQCWVLASDG